MSEKEHYVCKVKLSTKSLASFMYVILKYGATIRGSISIGLQQYTREQICRGQSEVLVCIPANSKYSFEADAGVELRNPPKINIGILDTEDENNN